VVNRGGTALATFLRIPLDKSKPHKQSLAFPQSTAPASMGILGNPNKKPLDYVVDTFSGGYWGEGDKGEYLSYFDNMIKGIETSIAQVNKTGKLPRESNQQGMQRIGAAALRPLLNPKEKQEYIDSQTKLMAQYSTEREKFDTSYTQHPDLIRSFDHDGAGWNKYFEGNYKNPRMTEASQYLNRGSVQSSGLDIKRKDLKIPKTIGTGLTSTGSLNPFGTLDAGLNI